MERARKLKGTDVVEADVRKVLGGLEAHRLFPDDPTARMAMLTVMLTRMLAAQYAWYVANLVVGTHVESVTALFTIYAAHTQATGYTSVQTAMGRLLVLTGEIYEKSV